MAADEEVLRAIGDSLDRPSAARVYDYFLGGTHHYAIDEAFGKKVEARMPMIPETARTLRQFLMRAVAYCARAGITQFVDIGSGLPTQGNVHEVADAVRPELDTRVVYIDNEPIALAHSQILLADTADEKRHTAVAADFLQPDDLWRRVLATKIIDRSQPVALVVNAVLHFVKDESGPDAALEYYRKRLAPGSLLVLSQVSNEDPADENERQGLRDLVEFYESTTNPGQMRTTAEFKRFFGDWELVEPGLVFAPAWHPDADTVLAKTPKKSLVIAGVARKPG